MRRLRSCGGCLRATHDGNYDISPRTRVRRGRNRFFLMLRRRGRGWFRRAGAASNQVAMPRQLNSVAIKLTGATIGLVAVVTAGVYLKLASYQRNNLFESKEAGTVAVTRLFADSCAAALVFNDPSTLQEQLGVLENNPQVEYAAVWDIRNAHLGSRLAELRRGPVVQLEDLQRLDQQRREPTRVVSLASIRDRGGRTVGAAAVAFSLARENEIIARIERTTLAVSSALAAALAVLLTIVVRLVIVRPLGKLAVAAGSLEDGTRVTLDIESDDEVGRLARAFRSMSTAIVSREERIRARNRDMRLVLDNVGQGFLTLALDGTVSEERSRIVDEWFGAPPKAVKIWDYVAQIQPSVRDWFEVTWLAVSDQYLPIDLCLDQLPKVISTTARIIELTYRPIFEGDNLATVIVVMTDATARIARERAERRQRETMNVFRRILSDRAAFDEFFDESSGLVRDIATPTGGSIPLKRQIHTLKGNCALYGIERVAELCHAMEDRLTDDQNTVSIEQTQLLSTLWGELVQLRSELAFQGGARTLDIDPQEHDRLLRNVQDGADWQQVISTPIAWSYEPASKRLSLIGEQIRVLAVRLGKADLDVNCLTTDLRLPPVNGGHFGPFRALDPKCRRPWHRDLRRSDRRGQATQGDDHPQHSSPRARRQGVHRGRWTGSGLREDRGESPRAGATCGDRKRLAGGAVRRRRFVEVHRDPTSGRGIGMGALREFLRGIGGDIARQLHSA